MRPHMSAHRIARLESLTAPTFSNMPALCLQVALHSTPGFLASLTSATTSEVVVPAVSTAVGGAVTAAKDAFKYLTVADHHHDYHPERHQQAGGTAGTTVSTGIAPMPCEAAPVSTTGSSAGDGVSVRVGPAPAGNIDGVQSGMTHHQMAQSSRLVTITSAAALAEQSAAARPTDVTSNGTGVRDSSGVGQGPRQDGQVTIEIAAVPLSEADVGLQEQKLRAAAHAPDAALPPAGVQYRATQNDAP